MSSMFWLGFSTCICNGVRSTVTSVHYRCKRKLAIVEPSVRFGANLTLFIYGTGAGAPVLFVNHSNLSRCLIG
ncbi:hypothetical protein PF005_g25900 [Phytophthora fragariae]|uniref:Secreted protein n=1 Tax=Phytophthora fragariae TaxID=53985 RepID=A0A6A3PGA7_9STRA|nr:hypothetical protein PF003_g17275 [Phytophthora fragariae]KAE8925383.1 hypothetical protein PF009_g24408 [Phytophthora fragariae]KAE8965579.1 hypothetical protein PF011_g28237 [Phytophthora fragariae]KAE9057622.1 hypothetical protein PF007_g31584 [Phytophthora fragariae]KAE9077681.1 hypothetical protein PF006_g27876 [Phytophthora fragariae]